MLQNASLLAIVAVDTAENEPSEVRHPDQDGFHTASEAAQLRTEVGMEACAR